VNGDLELQGPSFIIEPPLKLEFVNTRGSRLDCPVKGNPQPLVTWLLSDKSRVNPVPALLHVLENGSLYFPPFAAELFRQDVHWRSYRCMVTNSVGSLLSRDVAVRGGKFLAG